MTANLLKLYVTLDGNYSQALIDSGATHNFISAKLVS